MTSPKGADYEPPLCVVKMKEEKLKDFRWRLKTIGSISHYDSQWKAIFETYNFKWENWWKEYCEGMHNLVGDFTNDKIRDTDNEFRVRFFSSIFSKQGEDLFIKWLYYGKKKDLKPFYEWFKSYMNEKKKEREEQKSVEKKEVKRQKQSGYIYVLKSKNLYKIGRAKNLQSRIKTYKTENPFGIRVILQKEVDDYVKTEDRLLKKFKNKQVRGEWFELNKVDIQWIKQNL